MTPFRPRPWCRSSRPTARLGRSKCTGSIRHRASARPPIPRQRETAGQTVEQFLDHHISALWGVEKKTLAEYRRYLTRDITATLAPIPLTGLVRTDSTRWVNGLRDDGASGMTIQNKIGFLSGALNAAVRDGHLPANPAAGIRLPRTVRREMELLTPADFDVLKASFTDHWHPRVDLLVTSGCRFSEATALTPADIEMANGTTRIRQAWKRIPDGDGDGGVDRKTEVTNWT